VQRRIILVIAPSGSGKTHLISELIRDIDRVAVFDTVSDPQYFATDKNGTPREDVKVIEGSPRQFAEAIGSLNGMIGKEEGEFKVIYHPKKVTITITDQGLMESPEFGIIVRLCQERGHMYLVIDEAHLWCNTYNCPQELQMANLIGRHDGLSMILIAQRLVGVHPAIRENADEFYFWKVIQPRSLKLVEEYCGDDVAKQVKELRAVELDANDKFVKPGQYLHWTKFKGVVEVTE
jgi:hypothetical protein